MEPETRYTWIGAILIALLVAAVGSYLWLTRAGSAADVRHFLINFERQSVEGLQVGGAVNMRGVRVGRVESYHIPRDNINQVKVLVRLDQDTPISANTQATIARNLVTGVARINLDTPAPAGPPLTAPPAGEPYPVIAEGTSGLDQITDAVSELAVEGEATLKHLNEVLSADNRKAFAELLASVRDIAGGLNERLGRIDATMASFAGAAESLQQAGTSVSDAMRTITSQTAPVADEAAATLRAARGTLNELSKTARSLERSVGRAASTFETESSGLVRHFEGATDAGLTELRTTAQDLRLGLESLARALDRLVDPRAAILGPGKRQLGPGERLP